MGVEEKAACLTRVQTEKWREREKVGSWPVPPISEMVLPEFYSNFGRITSQNFSHDENNLHFLIYWEKDRRGELDPFLG